MQVARRRRRQSARSSARRRSRTRPRLFIGSHLDTVANAGAFDGILGVVLGVALVEHIVRRAARRIGRSAAALRHRGHRLLRRRGRALRQAVSRQPRAGRRAGRRDPRPHRPQRRHRRRRHPRLRPRPRRAARRGRSIRRAFGYLEFHIEQGPVLESEDRTARRRRRHRRPDPHAVSSSPARPTTPAPRPWARCAATRSPPPPQWVVEVERYANTTPGLVATVGKVESSSGAGNVIAGRVHRDARRSPPHGCVRHAAVAHFLDYAQRRRPPRAASPSPTPPPSTSPPCPWAPALSALLADAAARATGRERPLHHQRRRPRRHDRRPPRPRRHALPAQPRRPQPPPRRVRSARGRRSRSRHRGGVPADACAMIERCSQRIAARTPHRKRKTSCIISATPAAPTGATTCCTRRTPSSHAAARAAGRRGHRAHLARRRRSLHAIHRGARTRRHAWHLAHPPSASSIVPQGAVDLATDSSFQSLAPGGYAYIPAGLAHTLTAQQATRLAVIEKTYQPLEGVRRARACSIGSEASVPSTPLAGRRRPAGPRAAARSARLRLRRQHHDLPARRVAQHGRGPRHGARPADARRRRHLSSGRRLVPRHRRRLHLDGALLPAVVRRARQTARKISHL